MPELHEMPAESALPGDITNAPRRMTEDEFVAWCPEDLRAEWVDGEVVIMSSGNYEHVNLTSFLLAVLRTFVDEHDLGAVLGSEYAVRISSAQGTRRRLPDVLFLNKERLGLVQPTYLDGPPDLIIEIVSPESTERDWREKYLDYQAAGVREYWVIDPQNEQVAAYALSANGKYERIQEQGGRVVSSVLTGFFLRPAWLWEKPLPKVSETLRELGL